jgi:hypothetical protein
LEKIERGANSKIQSRNYANENDEELAHSKTKLRLGNMILLFLAGLTFRLRFWWVVIPGFMSGKLMTFKTLGVRPFD